MQEIMKNMKYTPQWLATIVHCATLIYLPRENYLLCYYYATAMATTIATATPTAIATAAAATTPILKPKLLL